MENPTLYVVFEENYLDTDSWEAGSNLDYLKQRAKEQAEAIGGTRIVYKLVPVFKAKREIVTNVLTEELSNEPPKG